jgi:hypothetical protein
MLATGDTLFGNDPLQAMFGAWVWAFAVAAVNYFFDVLVTSLEKGGDHDG